MKRVLLSVFAVACVLLAGAHASAQRRAARGAKQERVVRGQVLTSTRLPPLRVRFDRRFKYVGSQKFILYERARAEQHFFVDADARGLIRRMYMLQFEGYLPGVDATYNYGAGETVSLGGEDYVVNVEGVPDVRAVLAQQPQSDAARAVAFLERKGYRAGGAVRFQRFVRLVDESKRNEFIMLYVEDAGAGALNDERAVREFRARATRGFVILR